MPLQPTAATSAGETSLRANTSFTTVQKLPHQSVSASCSAQPGWGTCSLLGADAPASTRPLRSTSTALVWEVPTSTPMNMALDGVQLERLAEVRHDLHQGCRALAVAGVLEPAVDLEVRAHDRAVGDGQLLARRCLGSPRC